MICQEDHDQILADPKATTDELRDVIKELEAEVAALTETNKIRTTQLSQVTLELRQMQAGTLVEDLKEQVAALKQERDRTLT